MNPTIRLMLAATVLSVAGVFVIGMEADIASESLRVTALMSGVALLFIGLVVTCCAASASKADEIDRLFALSSTDHDA